MNSRAQALVREIEAFNREVIDCVRNCSTADWHKICKAEDWPVGVVARHLGDGHYRVVELARMIIQGTPLPDWTMADVIRMGNAHAREHADCSPNEVVSILETNGRSLCDYITTLSEDELDRKGQMRLMGAEVSAQQLLEMLILQSGGDHLKSIRTTIAE